MKKVPLSSKGRKLLFISLLFLRWYTSQSQSINANPDINSGCNGTTVTYTISYNGSPNVMIGNSWVILDANGNVIGSSAGSTSSMTVTWSTSGTVRIHYAIRLWPSNEIREGDVSRSFSMYPQGSASFSYPQSSFCLSAGGVYSPTVSISGANDSFSASPAGLSINSDNGQINIGASSAGSYTVTHTDHCSSSVASTSVTINPTFVPTVTISNATPLSCGVNNFTANANGTGTYSWYVNGNLAQTGGSTFSPTLSSGQSIYVVFTPNVPCPQPASVTSNTITIPQPPQGLQAWNDGISQRYFCYSFPAPRATLTATSVSGAVYHWYTDNGWAYNSSAGDNDVQVDIPSGTHRYYVYVTLNGCASNTAFTDVEVKPFLPSVNARHDTPVCTGQSLNLHADNATGGTYSWTGPNGFTSTAQHPVIANVSAAQAGTYTVTLVNEQCSGTSTSTTVSLTQIATAGSIGGSQTICSGVTPTSLTNTLSGTNGTYQWQSSPNGSSWTDITGATSATYAPGPLTATTHYKRLTISSCNTAETTAVVITVLPLPNAGAIATSGATTVCVGTTVTFTNTTSGTNGTYQWQQSVDGGSTWNNISGATSATYITPALTANISYKRNVISASCGTVSSAPVPITMIPQPVAGAIGGGPQTICSGATPAPLTDVTAGAGTYQWQLSTNAGTTWSDIVGVTGAAYSPGALTVTTQFRRGATSCSNNVYTTAMVVNIYPPASAGQIGGAQTLCSGSTPSALTNVTSGFSTYQWQSSPNGTTWTNISGATAATYTPPALTSTTNYRRNATSCGTTVSSNVIIKTVTQPKKADFTYDASAYCPWHSAISPPANPVVAFTNGGVAGAFSASPSGLSITPGSGAINLNQSNSGTYTVTNTIAAAGGCPVVTKTATLEIRPRTTFTINEVEENGIRNYYIEQAESDPAWRDAHTYNWWYINVKPRRVNATDDNYPWMTVGMFQPLSFVLDIVTDESLIIDVTENSTGCKTRVELGRDVVDGAF